MSHLSKPIVIPPSQQFIRDKCFHPSGEFVAFKKEDVEGSIPRRFEQQVAKSPHRLAVKAKGHQLTYDELNRAANHVAHAVLAQRGEGEEPVALLLEQGISLTVGLLGILKAGKFYVPLDASFPHARSGDMLEDSQAGLIVNNKNLSLVKELAQSALQIVNIDALDSNLSTENPGLSISPDCLACILYTSGSTGQPKGVIQNHRNVLHFSRIYTNGFHICPDDRLSFLASSSVTAPLWDMFGALLNGATLFPFNLKQEGVGTLAKWLSQEEITIYNSVTTVFRHFAGALTGEAEFPKLRLIRIGGESVYKHDVTLYKRHFSQDCILHNGLGATEVKIFRRYFIDKETEITGNIVPAGYAVEGAKVVLLNDTGDEVDFNQVGEIAVKSRYLSLGYWRRPDLTQAKFLPDPNGSDERIYLTGDLGRMLPDGCLVHLDRKDFQVQIRGYRVEIAEIETVLLDHPAIKEAVVVAQGDQTGNKRLVAYLVLHRKPAPTVTTLRQVLAETLPSYMIPSTFMMLDSLPLTPTGKVDRRALPTPDTERPKLEVAFVAPRTPVEESLAEIWSEVLGIDPVGIADNFLELGGNSLLATQVISRVLNTFQVELPLRSLFDSPAVADMAVVITQNQAQKAEPQDLDRMLAELEQLSDEEAQRRLADEDE